MLQCDKSLYGFIISNCSRMFEIYLWCRADKKAIDKIAPHPIDRSEPHAWLVYSVVLVSMTRVCFPDLLRTSIGRCRNRGAARATEVRPGECFNI